MVLNLSRRNIFWLYRAFIFVIVACLPVYGQSPQKESLESNSPAKEEISAPELKSTIEGYKVYLTQVLCELENTKKEKKEYEETIAFLEKTVQFLQEEKDISAPEWVQLERDLRKHKIIAGEGNITSLLEELEEAKEQKKNYQNQLKRLKAQNNTLQKEKEDFHAQAEEVSRQLTTEYQILLQDALAKLKEAKAQSNDYAKKAVKLEQQAQTLEAEIAEYKKSWERTAAQLKQVEGKEKKNLEEIASLQGEINAVKTAWGENEHLFKNTIEEARKKEIQDGNKIKYLEGERERYAKVLAEENTRWEKEVQAQQEQIAGLQKEKKILQTERGGLQTLANNLEQAQKQALGQIAALQEETKAAPAAFTQKETELTAKIKEYKDCWQEAFAKLEETEASQEELRQKTLALDKEKQSLKDEIRTLNAAVTDSEKEKTINLAKITDLGQNLEEQKFVFARREAELEKQYTRHTKELKATVEKYKVALRETVKELTDSNLIRQEYIQANRQLKKQIAQGECKIKGLEQEIPILTKKLEQMGNMGVSLEEEKEDFAVKNRTLAAERSELEKIIQVFQAENDALKEDRNTLNVKIAQLDETIAGFKEEKKQSLTKIDELQRAMESYRRLFTQRKADLESQFRQKDQSWQQEIAGYKSSYEKVLAKLDQAGRENNKYADQLKQSEQTFQKKESEYTGKIKELEQELEEYKNSLFENESNINLETINRLQENIQKTQDKVARYQALLDKALAELEKTKVKNDEYADKLDALEKVSARGRR